MARASLIILLCFVASAVGRQATLRTRDGRIYEGYLRLETNGFVIANAAEGYLAFVDLTNLWALTFKREAPARVEETALEPGALPRSWRHEDVGRTEISGHATHLSGLFRLQSSGTNIVGESDAFHFVYKTASGDNEIVARLVSIQPAWREAKAGLMMRENLRADAANVFFGITGRRETVLQWRESAARETTVTNRRDMLVAQWIKLKREGDTFSGYRSGNGRQWGLVEKISMPMAGDVYVGIAAGGVSTETWLGSGAVVRCALDNVKEGSPSVPISSFVPQVELQSGSRIAGPIAWADDDAIHFPGASWREPVSTRAVSRILFQWVPYRFNSIFRRGRPGALLTNGQFVEGDFRRIEANRVQLSSVLFGLRSLDLNSQVMAVVLRKPAATRHQFEVKTIDGSVWLSMALETAQNAIVLREDSLGSHRISAHQLQEIQRSR